MWKSRSVHEDTIRDIAWHPYVPYWLASASDDNHVQFYDIRYSTRPLYVLHEHYGSVNSVSTALLIQLQIINTCIID